jgi:xanthine dehydrogenase accessory factor
MKEILSEILTVIEAGDRAALSTIVSAKGSLPMSRRSKMLVLRDGSIRGTVGGGCLEAEVQSRGREVLDGDGDPVLNRYVLTEKQAGAEGLNCGGTVEILTEPLGPGPVALVLAACLETIERREEAVLATALRRPDRKLAGKIVMRRDGSIVGSLGGSLDEAVGSMARPLMGTDTIRVEEIPGAGKIFLETIEVTPTVVLFGGGHVSREVARVAKTAGFRVVVVDDRAYFASPERHPEADEVRVVAFDRAIEAMDVDVHTYLVAVTRGHQHDEVVIRQALRTRAGYVGMIGSGRKVALMRRRLATEGFTPEELDRLHAPIGLDIGADTPGEIAVSIVAELVAARRGGSGSSLSLSGRLRV